MYGGLLIRVCDDYCCMDKDCQERIAGCFPESRYREDHTCCEENCWREGVVNAGAEQFCGDHGG